MKLKVICTITVSLLRGCGVATLGHGRAATTLQLMFVSYKKGSYKIRKVCEGLTVGKPISPN